MSNPTTIMYDSQLSLPLQECDPEMYNLIHLEKVRQNQCLNLIASENYQSFAAQEVLGSCLANKYSEGYPGDRFYGGNEIIDKIENLCIERCLKAFKLDANIWHINVQPLSGSPANLAVLLGLLKPHDRIMGLSINQGGHITHGAYNELGKISGTSIFFESLSYTLDPKTGLLDFEQISDLAKRYRPKILICGYSAYPRKWDYSKFRKIADEIDAYLWCDMAHISGLIAGGVLDSPFDYCDVVSTTTHKTLRGPRSGMIFINKIRIPNGPSQVDKAVFPGLQGGPHMNAIGALAQQLLMVSTDNWKAYARQVVDNCISLANALKDLGYILQTGGTDNHLLLIDMKPFKLDGVKMHRLCDHLNIALNRYVLIGDRADLPATGVRLGSAPMTTRGLGASEFKKIAELFDMAVKLACEIQACAKDDSEDSFIEAIEKFEKSKIDKVRNCVVEFCEQFPMPGRTDI